jgi:hypothetical protein
MVSWSKAISQRLRRKLVSDAPPKFAFRLLFARSHRALLRLKNPQTFNEKVQWRKIYDRRELIAGTCDKLSVKEFAARHGVQSAETLWHGVDPTQVPDLSGEWVMKPNHQSGIVHFGAGTPDRNQLAELFPRYLREYGEAMGEWAYTRARREILIERRLGRPGVDLPDYKFFCFSGDVALIQVDTYRSTDHRRRLYSADWTPLDARLHYPMAPAAAPPPEADELIASAQRLSAEFDFIRVDLYAFEGRVYLGEMTPYPGSGLQQFEPRDLDYDLGRRWQLR